MVPLNALPQRPIFANNQTQSFTVDQVDNLNQQQQQQVQRTVTSSYRRRQRRVKQPNYRSNNNT